MLQRSPLCILVEHGTVWPLLASKAFFPLGVLGLAFAKACSKPTTTTGTVLLTAGLFQDFAFIYTQPWNSPQTAQQPLLTQATTATRLKALVKAIVPNSPQWYRRRLYCTKAACYRLYNQTAIQQIATIYQKIQIYFAFLLENLHWCVFRKIVSDCQVKSGYLCQLVRVLDKIVLWEKRRKSLPRKKKSSNSCVWKAAHR